MVSGLGEADPRAKPHGSRGCREGAPPMYTERMESRAIGESQGENAAFPWRCGCDGITICFIKDWLQARRVDLVDRNTVCSTSNREGRVKGVINTAGRRQGEWRVEQWRTLICSSLTKMILFPWIILHTPACAWIYTHIRHLVHTPDEQSCVVSLIFIF